ncbi:UNVERIFIED_CONTAM: putative pentatricopeptide repeat-containing protein, mitochondrial [Sesamum radiatum]|uniref:Pentatricopeptide repeat-containing protein, mitochondrial n=1 Tax=Sesamum radiatum TaxID=300843 RepID=A0AAW2RXI8_SESRA
MGCHFASLQMRNRPQTVFRGILSTFHGVPGRCSTFSLTKNHLFYSFASRSSFSTAALRTTEKPKREFSYRRNREKILAWHESKESQSCYVQVSVNQGVERSRRLRGGSESVSETSRLKSYSEVLRNCAAEMCLNKGKVIHCRIIRSGVEPDMHLWVSLINFYAKCGALEFSYHVFEQMPLKDVVSWTALISGFVAQGYGVESVELFYEMRRKDVRANEFTFATVLKGCSMSLDLEFGKQLHGEVVKVGCLSDVYVGAALIDLYSKCVGMNTRLMFFV